MSRSPHLCPAFRRAGVGRSRGRRDWPRCGRRQRRRPSTFLCPSEDPPGQWPGRDCPFQLPVPGHYLSRRGAEGWGWMVPLPVCYRCGLTGRLTVACKGPEKERRCCVFVFRIPGHFSPRFVRASTGNDNCRYRPSDERTILARSRTTHPKRVRERRLKVTGHRAR